MQHGACTRMSCDKRLARDFAGSIYLVVYHDVILHIEYLEGPPMGFRGMRDKTFFVCGIRDWLENCRGIRDANICGTWDWPTNYRGIRDSNISREWDKVRNFFSIREMVNLQSSCRIIEIATVARTCHYISNKHLD